MVNLINKVLGNKAVYKAHKYNTIEEAKKKQLQMKKDFGYKPNIFKETHPKMPKYLKFVVVEPKGLRKLKD